ncbi:MAG: hypothetical protein HC772_15735 [Leptolyngbyaceae cyanobacterium CRU_2_3]|nr:hypothetical protein [Leptolyngbyaceae cyanobacterium CRU_2_3]
MTPAIAGGWTAPIWNTSELLSDWVSAYWVSVEFLNAIDSLESLFSDEDQAQVKDD